MFFKWKSRYGVDLGQDMKSSLKYSGKAYCPEGTTIAYTDIKPGEEDPCSLVLPAGTWRLPSTEEFLNLTKGGSKEWKTESYRMCSDGEQNVYLAASCQLNKAGTGVFMPKRIFVWTGDAGAKADNGKFLLWYFTSEEAEAKVTDSGINKNQGLQVRCVRDK